jgi:hypothetical protein
VQKDFGSVTPTCSADLHPHLVGVDLRARSSCNVQLLVKGEIRIRQAYFGDDNSPKLQHTRTASLDRMVTAELKWQKWQGVADRLSGWGSLATSTSG